MFNDLLCAAACCDPRYRLLLSDNQRERGVDTLQKIVLQLIPTEELSPKPAFQSVPDAVPPEPSLDIEEELGRLAAAARESGMNPINTYLNILSAFENCRPAYRLVFE